MQILFLLKHELFEIDPTSSDDLHRNSSHRGIGKESDFLGCCRPWRQKPDDKTKR
jgi:hypothetical protein